jgi:hypothetical protein
MSPDSCLWCEVTRHDFSASPMREVIGDAFLQIRVSKNPHIGEMHFYKPASPMTLASSHRRRRFLWWIKKRNEKGHYILLYTSHMHMLYPFFTSQFHMLYPLYTLHPNLFNSYKSTIYKSQIHRFYPLYKSQILSHVF